MIADRARRARRATVLTWALLVFCVAAWPIADAGIGFARTAFALLPLLMPVRGILRGARHTLQWSPLALAPALALALTELLANAAARFAMTLTLTLMLAAFAAVVAALRTIPRA